MSSADLRGLDICVSMGLELTVADAINCPCKLNTWIACGFELFDVWPGIWGVADDEEDYDLKIYTEVIPIRVVMGAPRPCPRLQQGVDRPENLKGYRQGRLLEDAVKEGRAKSYS